jgi:hypothetical protein
MIVNLLLEQKKEGTDLEVGLITVSKLIFRYDTKPEICSKLMTIRKTYLKILKV